MAIEWSGRVVGIDPGLATMAMALLESPRRDAYAVMQYKVVRTAADSPIEERLRLIHRNVSDFVSVCAPIDAVVVENPMHMTAAARRNKRGKVGLGAPHRDVAALHLATGVAVGAAVSHPVVALFDVAYWMPRAQTGKLTHTARREDTLRLLSQWIDLPLLRATEREHVIMAAGVARRWIEDKRLERQRAAQGIRV
jgi:Holliday junction resolvasome RuvABC endonuclease subunit